MAATATATSSAIGAGQLELLSSTDAFAEEVAADHREAVARGIRAMPSVITDDVVVSGARSVEELTRLLGTQGGAAR